MGTDNVEMNEHGCIPAHLWALKFEFQFFTCNKILDFFFFQLFSDIKATAIRPKAIQIQVVDQIWAVIH